MTVDTTKPITVVTQFHTSDGTDNGDLSEVRRIFVQDGKVIQHPKSNIPGLSAQHDSITSDMCDSFKDIMGDKNDFKKKGGLKKMGDAMSNGMVLVMSIWDDHAADMLWLDSTYPTTKTTIGGPRGACATTSGVPKDVSLNLQMLVLNSLTSKSVRSTPPTSHPQDQDQLHQAHPQPAQEEVFPLALVSAHQPQPPLSKLASTSAPPDAPLLNLSSNEKPLVEFNLILR